MARSHENTTKTPSRSKANGHSRYDRLKAEVIAGPDMWLEVEGTLLISAISGALDNGDLISFSRTSDGGAILVCVISGQDKHRMYAATSIELAELIGNLAELE